MANPAYTAKDITVLEGLEPVRLRPGMYIGSTGARGLHHLVYEVVDNAVDEALAGVNDSIEVKIHPQEFARGVPQGEMKTVGITKETGTTISFLPDAEIFDETEFHAPTLLSRLREMAFLTRGLRITFTDERADAGEPVEFHYERGIKDCVAYVNESKDIVHKHIVYFTGANEQGEVEVAM